MPSQCKTHEVTVGEILRRVLKPESLNVSLLGPILRKAKSKHGSHHLRLRLQQIGVDLPVGRRKTAQCSLFTSLTESIVQVVARMLCLIDLETSKIDNLHYSASAMAPRLFKLKFCVDFIG